MVVYVSLVVSIEGQIDGISVGIFIGRMHKYGVFGLFSIDRWVSFSLLCFGCDRQTHVHALAITCIACSHALYKIITMHNIRLYACTKYLII